MIMQLAGRIVAMTGWSPEGKAVVLENAEGPWAESIGNSSGKILFIHRAQKEADDLIFMVLDCPVKKDGTKIDQLVLIPRHAGYDASCLLLTRISVYVFDASDQIEYQVPSADAMLALADLRLVKSEWHRSLPNLAVLFRRGREQRRAL